MGLISTHLVNLLLCSLKMKKINRQVNSAVSYPNLVSFQSSAFMFDINLWIENNHMKCSSHMAFLCVQNFTLLQKRIEVFVANSMIKKNHQFFFLITFFFNRNCQLSIYGPSRDQQIYKDVWKKILPYFVWCPDLRCWFTICRWCQLRTQRSAGALTGNQLLPNTSLERDGKMLIDLVDGLSSGPVVVVSVTDGDPYFVNSEIWLNPHIYEHHLNYITKLNKKRKKFP